MNDKYQQALDNVIKSISNDIGLPIENVKEIPDIEILQQLIDYTRPLEFEEIKCDVVLYDSKNKETCEVMAISENKEIFALNFKSQVFTSLEKFENNRFYRLPEYMKEDKE